MPNRKTAVENTTLLDTSAVAPPDDGASALAQPEIEKAINLVELKKDLAQLQQQAIAISGAIQYLQQKIAQLTKIENVPKA